jgi:signal transduction histidine kinase
VGARMDLNRLEVELGVFAAHLHERRSAILAAWSRASESDPKITTSTTLSRAQFYDHIPNMLDALERRLHATRPGERLSAKQDETTNAEGHGLQRWQQGYNEQEVMREWIWLNECLADEIESYAKARPQLAPGVMSSAWRLIAQFLVMGMSESVGQYAALQRADASARLLALEDALRELTLLEQQRAQAWREAAHDLRGNLSIVNNVATVLQSRSSLAPPLQSSLSMLERGVSSLRALLDDLTTQARLDAGREQRELTQFDAAQALAELCASSQSIAAAHGLFLKTEGAQGLIVEGDRVKMCRIAQNLLLNALHYTKDGGVKVNWEVAGSGAERWVLCVQDTGPGLGTQASAPLSVALDAATRDTQKLEKDAAETGSEGGDSDEAPTLASRSTPDADRPGEGIGLAIVKRLCELLDASLELQTEPGRGTTFRVTFPISYPKG